LDDSQRIEKVTNDDDDHATISDDADDDLAKYNISTDGYVLGRAVNSPGLSVLQGTALVASNPFGSLSESPL
jgi:hypothetical protein